MAFRLSRTAENEIKLFLSEIEDGFVKLAVRLELNREIEKLAADPNLATAPTGPFETRPIYRCRLVARPQHYLASISSRIGKDKVLEVLLFEVSPV